ncbi:type II toxin-antitoxin system RelE/ParE family toxin [Dyadobacter sediminis]|uniref:Type II toxin-antitoxin system RelE/ParE family toxin n=1 Tax=Dyadobacter sediminis TaxID=1493691 RepID=A0A5R9K610_9BACT|nr:type II toxin-antitoxin system RelE/ParE family toxin [Dyadobacter sediminis]GGC02722.1 hypothetical protein GCM10011325_32300 [Dyadobacter sediminis]
MVYKIKWTEIAKDNYHEMVSYIYDILGETVAERFTDELQSSLGKLEMFPFIGMQRSILSSVRKLTVGKHHILFYTVIDNSEVVLNVLDCKRFT